MLLVDVVRYVLFSELHDVCHYSITTTLGICVCKIKVTSIFNTVDMCVTVFIIHYFYSRVHQ